MEKNKRLSLSKAIGCCLSNSSFKGRSRRSEFWWYTLLFVCLSIATSWLQGYLSTLSSLIKEMVAWGLLLVQLLASYYQLAVTFRRLHDIGKSGWWAGILALLSVLGNGVRILVNEKIGTILELLFFVLFLIIILGFCTIDSQKEENRYGTSPKYDMDYERGTPDFFDSPLGKISGCIFMLIFEGFAIGLILGIVILISVWLCNIEPNTTYSWYSGLWHGMFFLPNLIRSWFGDTLYKAEHYTAAYNIFWWFIVISQGFLIIGGLAIFGGGASRN